MADEILNQKRRFARQVLVLLKVSIALYILLGAGAVVYAVINAKLSAGLMGGIAVGASILLFWLCHRRVKLWLAHNQVGP